MVIDTSALLAVLLNEPGANEFRFAIEGDAVRLVSAAAVVEAGIAVEARVGEAGGRELDLLLQKAAVEVVPVDAEQSDLARHAYRNFGKGRHAAGLNYGDCFSYALAQATGESLLCKGQDFAKTDVLLWRPVEKPGQED
jgi:ribonuclease VapC